MQNRVNNCREIQCQHRNFEAAVNVDRIEHIGQFVVEIEVWCKDCETPFTFEGLPVGLDYTQPTVSLNLTEARLPMVPKDE